MRRRLIRLIGLMVVLPVTARAAEQLADRLEDRNGPSVPSRLLRQASALADRRSPGSRGRSRVGGPRAGKQAPAARSGPARRR